MFYRPIKDGNTCSEIAAIFCSSKSTGNGQGQSSFSRTRVIYVGANRHDRPTYEYELFRLRVPAPIIEPVRTVNQNSKAMETSVVKINHLMETLATLVDRINRITETMETPADEVDRRHGSPEMEHPQPSRTEPPICY